MLEFSLSRRPALASGLMASSSGVLCSPPLMLTHLMSTGSCSSLWGEVGRCQTPTEKLWPCISHVQGPVPSAHLAKITIARLDSEMGST